MKKTAELVFIPAPGIGHFISTAEFAKCLIDRDERLSITILVIHRPGNPPAVAAKAQSLAASDSRIRCINIPPVEPPSTLKSPENFMSVFIESHKPHVEHAITNELMSDDSVQLAGIVVDLFCTSMIDVANQLKVPSYLFFASGAAFLGLMLYLPGLHDRIGAEYSPSDADSIVETFANPVPTNVLPTCLFNPEGYASFLYHGSRFKETNGYIINTFAELEPYAMNSLISKPPPVYTVGPLLDLHIKGKSAELCSKWDEIVAWLDDQPPLSVVFLCFGSKGSFDAPQLEQIAMALQRSEHRFIWSIRCPPPKGTVGMPTEYQNFQDVLPLGFLERTEKKGKVCGWAPQVEVLAHPAVGGFVSHCGWNSILESLWFGVPIATWPLYAEQQTNAFQMVRELELAVELKMDNRLSSGEVVQADVIEQTVNRLMDGDNPVRKRVKEMSEKSRMAVVDGGSSHASLGRLIENVLKNIYALDS